MKWFLRIGGRTPALMGRGAALDFYKLAVQGGKFASLRAVEALTKGKYISYVSYDIWGEKISDKECFHRILKGELYKRNDHV